MFSAWCQAELLTADCFCIEPSGDAEFKLSLEGQLWPNYKKHWDYVPGKATHVECWNCMTISFSRCPLCKKTITKIKSAVQHLFMFVCFVVQLSTLQCTTTTVSGNNKQYRYISVLLLWSQIVLLYCFRRKCLLHWTVPVECWGERYFWFMLVENMNCNVRLCAEEICSTCFAESIQSSWTTFEYA